MLDFTVLWNYSLFGTDDKKGHIGHVWTNEDTNILHVVCNNKEYIMIKNELTENRQTKNITLSQAHDNHCY